MKFLKTHGEQMKKAIMASLNTFLNTLIKQILQEQFFATCKYLIFKNILQEQFFATTSISFSNFEPNLHTKGKKFCKKKKNQISTYIMTIFRH